MEHAQKELNSILHENIPLSDFIGINVDHYDTNSLTLAAPLGNNLNDKNTAFAGSLYSIAVLAGWGLIYLRLKEEGLAGDIVNQESSIKYIRPVTEQIKVNCHVSSEKSFEKFLTMFRKKGIARISLAALINQDGEKAVVFHGRYVAYA